MGWPSKPSVRCVTVALPIGMSVFVQGAKISRFMVGLGFLDDLMSEQFELQRTMNEAA